MVARYNADAKLPHFARQSAQNDVIHSIQSDPKGSADFFDDHSRHFDDIFLLFIFGHIVLPALKQRTL